MKCHYLPRLDNFEDSTLPSHCDNEATHDRNCGQDVGAVCAEHTCRCSIALEEVERRRLARIIPSHWMAL